MEEIFVMVVHLVKAGQSDGSEFQQMLDQLRTDLGQVGTAGVHASVTIVAETGLFSCEVAIGIKCEDESVTRKIDIIADRYRGTHLLGEALKVRA